MGDEDVDVEANWYDELAGAFESLGPEYRRAARLLRFAGGALRPGDVAALRRQLAEITRKVIDATAIGRSLLEPEGGGLE